MTKFHHFQVKLEMRIQWANFVVQEDIKHKKNHFQSRLNLLSTIILFRI